MTSEAKIKWSAGERGGPRPGSMTWRSPNREWRIHRTDSPNETPDYDIYQFGIWLTATQSLKSAKAEVEMLRASVRP